MPPVFEISTYIDVGFLGPKITIDIRFFYLYIRTNLFIEIKVILLSNNVFVNIEKIFKKSAIRCSISIQISLIRKSI